jgi:hypothetical protein
MRQMRVRAALWLGFVIIVVHNIEEYLAMGPFLAAHRDQLPAFLRSMTGEQFAVSLVIATLLGFFVIWFAARSRMNGPWLVLAIAFQVGLVLNALQHAVVGVWAGGYAPGVVTGLLLNLPYAVYLIRRALREGWVRIKPLIITALVVLVLMAPLVLGIHALSILIL